MANPTGKNQYSGNGKGAKQISVMSARTGKRLTSTRDSAAQQLRSLRTMKGIVKGRQNQRAISAQIGNYRAAAKAQSKK